LRLQCLGARAKNPSVRIRSILLLLTIVVLAPVFIAAAVAVTKVREAQREAALRGLRETVRATSLLVDGQVQRSIGALTSLAQSRNLENADFPALYPQAQAIDRAPDVWTLVFDSAGAQRLNTALPFGTPLPVGTPPERAVADALAKGAPHVSDLIVGPLTKKLVTRVYVPGKPSVAGTFVVAQAIGVEHWEKLALRSSGRPEWIVAVIDRTGKFIWRSHRTQEYSGRQARPELVAAAAAAPSGMIRHATLEGIDAYDAFAHSSLTGWTIAVAAPVPTIETSATRAVAWLAGGLALALVVSLLGAAALGRVLLGAMNTASRAAGALGRGEPPAPARTPVREVNALHDALGEASRLLADVERQRQQLLADERASRQKAEEENHAKDRFLALLGHELRNPLAAISGASDVLNRGEADEPTRRRFLELIQRQNRHLRRIVDDLLDVSRMLTGKIVLNTHPLDLEGCLVGCIDSLRATERARRYDWEVSTHPVWVDGDPVRLEQVINNLVVNAMQFSPPGSEISIALAAEGDEAVLQVRDHGAGIDADMQARIFGTFVQGPPLEGQQSAGLGIGLSLVRQLVRLHGGQVNVRSAGRGTGSMFVVRLPRIPVPTVAHAEPVESALPTEARRVLLVDDNADARESAAYLLRTLGHTVTEAGDAEAALRSAREAPPDVVIMDLGLPGKTGYELAAEMRAEPALARLPLVALSGYGQERDRARALAAGFVEHLVKPPTLHALASVVQVHGVERQPRG
jgi:signal transduction histidine kinase/ActR/RegA family two-component response regulator